MTVTVERQHVDCPLCDADDAAVLHEPWVAVDDPEVLYGAASGIPGTQRLVRCRQCGMVYEDPRYPEEVILRGYASSREVGHDSQYEMRVASFLRALRRLSGHLPAPGGRVLDIGAAGGAFLKAADLYGYHACGLEPSRYLVDAARGRGLDVQQGTIADNPYLGQVFDLVCLWDVLEHLAAPREALLSIATLLRPGGVLLINYPDIGTPMAALAGRRFWWILSVHLHHYSRSTLRRMCERSGYRVSHFQRYWQTLELGYLEDMAIHFRFPLSKVLKRLTPRRLKALPIPYYASQTTALACLDV